MSWLVTCNKERRRNNGGDGGGFRRRRRDGCERSVSDVSDEIPESVGVGRTESKGRSPYRNGVGMLVEVQGNMNAERYCEILDEGLVESFEKLEMAEGERYFQQDNEPKHVSGRATTWFQDHNIIVIHWPAQSPDKQWKNKCHHWSHMAHKTQPRN